MLQQRKKDYFQRIIEEFFKKLNDLINAVNEDDPQLKNNQLNSCFQFFFDNFDVSQDDSTESILTKIDDTELSEQYAKLLLIEHQITDSKSMDRLHKALDLVDFLDNTDSTYSWGRVMLKEDILRMLDTDKQKA